MKMKKMYCFNTDIGNGIVMRSDIGFCSQH